MSDTDKSIECVIEKEFDRTDDYFESNTIEVIIPSQVINLSDQELLRKKVEEKEGEQEIDLEDEQSVVNHMYMFYKQYREELEEPVLEV